MLSLAFASYAIIALDGALSLCVDLENSTNYTAKNVRFGC